MAVIQVLQQYIQYRIGATPFQSAVVSLCLFLCVIDKRKCKAEQKKRYKKGAIKTWTKRNKIGYNKFSLERENQ